MNRNRSLLWEIIPPNTNIVSYLGGTVHLWLPDVEAIAKLYYPYILQCDSLAIEADVEEMAQLPSDTFTLPYPLTLRYIYGKERYTKMAEILEEAFNIPISRFEYFSPLAVLNYLGYQILEDQESSMDKELWKFAKANQKHVFGLETVEEQFDYYRRIKLSAQMEQLWKMLNNLESYKEQLKNIVVDFVNQDISKLYESAKKSNSKYKHMLLDERNVIMCMRIMEFSKRSSIFAAVGSGHLAGNLGILKLLKKQGFSVKPVKL